MRVKSCVKNIGYFHFSKFELKNEDIQYVLQNKLKLISDSSGLNAALNAALRPTVCVNNKVSRSVYAIPSGLYGLGKNRRPKRFISIPDKK
jgi:hypothetical protein